MNGETTRDLLLILVMAMVTFATRLLPFLLFDRGEEPPKAVLYLGRVLPPAIMAMLIVYCLKGVSFATPAGWVPALLSCGAVVLLHLWKGNDLLSIFGGTILYMALVQGVFGEGGAEMEDCLAALRQEVDRLDDQIAELFLKRMEVTGRIGACKEELGLPLMDPRRELEVLRSAAAETLDEGRKLELAHLFETVLALSRRDLRRRVGGNDPGPGYSRCRRAEAAARQPVERPRVVYQGVAGAYSEMASLRFFGEDCRCQGLPTFEEVFQTVAQGGADYGVVPIENSSTGAIRQVYELLGRYECYIVGENTVKVEHCLMAPHGATLDTITHVYSHEQGLFQCEPFLARHPGWVGVAHGDTAGSAQYVAQTGDITKAAICSSRAAELYGLEILARGVNYNSNNTTRFVVVSPVMELREGADKISAVLSLPDEVGSLHEVLTIFAVHGLNLVKLESRPLPGRSWEYLFFLEFDGSLADPAMDGALQELSQASAEMRVLGNFKSNL